MGRAAEGESCKSGQLSSWLLMKSSCFRNQQHRIIKQQKQKQKQSSISTLPDDLLLECICRVCRSSLPTIPLVCRRWSLLLHSPSFFIIRRHLFLIRPTLFSLLLLTTNNRFATLHLNNPASSPSSWNNTPSFSLPPTLSLLLLLPSHARLAAIGPHIYIVGRSATVRCDVWTGNVSLRSAMIYSRKKFAAAVVAGKIYVTGGAARASAVEEYDPRNNTWCVVSDAPRRRYGCLGTSVEGIFYIIGGLKIGQGGSEAHHVYTSSMDLYEVDSSTWLRSRVVPGGGCVVAACSADGHVYILASHAVELSFWRFDGRRVGGRSFGEWQKLNTPRLYSRLDNTMRFSCVGIGNKVVLIQVTGCFADLIRRGGMSNGGGGASKQALVMIYNCDDGDWSRGPDIPDVVPHAACVCVEC